MPPAKKSHDISNPSGVMQVRYRTYRKTSSQGLLKPHASSTDDRLMDLESLATADEFCICKVASLQELQVAGSQAGVVCAEIGHDGCNGAAMYRIEWGLMVAMRWELVHSVPAGSEVVIWLEFRVAGCKNERLKGQGVGALDVDCQAHFYVW